MLGLDGPPKFKSKKLPKDEFERVMGDSLDVSIRSVENFFPRFNADFSLDMTFSASRLMLMCIGSLTRVHSNLVDLMGSSFKLNPQRETACSD
jgi:hypothetical protein